MKSINTPLIFVALTIVMANISCRNDSTQNVVEAEKMERPAIVLVAFGTSNTEARKVFDYIDAAARRRYPDYDIRWAFTSQFILKKLRSEGVDVKSLDQVVRELKSEGRTSAVFQSLHVAPGQEYREIEKIDTSGLRTSVGKALLAKDEDIEAVASAIKCYLDVDAVNVLVCHGNDHYPKFNSQLIALAETVESRHDNVFVCSISGQPGIDKLQEARRQAAKTKAVNFVPMMIVAGVHVMEDVMSEEPESWKSVVDAAETTCSKPVGYNDEILEIYFRHLDNAIKKICEESPSDDTL